MCLTLATILCSVSTLQYRFVSYLGKIQQGTAASDSVREEMLRSSGTYGFWISSGPLSWVRNGYPNSLCNLENLPQKSFRTSSVGLSGEKCYKQRLSNRKDALRSFEAAQFVATFGFLHLNSEVDLAFVQCLKLQKFKKKIVNMLQLQGLGFDPIPPEGNGKIHRDFNRRRIKPLHNICAPKYINRIHSDSENVKIKDRTLRWVYVMCWVHDSSQMENLHFRQMGKWSEICFSL